MKRHAPSPRAARGFTLLEAIIALVVFSMGAMALYGWLSTNIITLNRIKERQQVEASMLSALDMIRRTNPMETPAGQRQAGALQVVWTSVPVEPARPNAHHHIMAIAAFSLALAGRVTEAHEYTRKIRERVSDYSIGDFLAAFRFAADADATFRQAAGKIGLA